MLDDPCLLSEMKDRRIEGPSAAARARRLASPIFLMTLVAVESCHRPFGLGCDEASVPCRACTAGAESRREGEGEACVCPAGLRSFDSYLSRRPQVMQGHHAGRHLGSLPHSEGPCIPAGNRVSRAIRARLAGLVQEAARSHLALMAGRSRPGETLGMGSRSAGYRTVPRGPLLIP